MQLHLIRHGQTSWNIEGRIQGQTEIPLDDTGRQQATALGPIIRELPLVALYCSSSIRTRQTMALLLEHPLDEPVESARYRDDLREITLGVWEGQLWEDIEASEPAMARALVTASPDFQVERAETRQAVQLRGVRAIESIIEEVQSEPDMAEHEQAGVLVVSHGAIIKMILAHYLGIELSELSQLPSLSNCAHCILDVHGGTRSLTQVDGRPLAETPWSIAEPPKRAPIADNTSTPA